MHEYSTNPDVAARLRDETEWAVRCRRRNVELSPDDSGALLARIEELEEANAAVEEENDLLRDVIQQKHSRIEVLTAALTDALEGMAEMRPRAERYANKGKHDGYITRARAALAAGETESEA